jgi:hypothetical protein
MAENIYPSDFFNISHPGAPYVNIQFRNAVTGDITNKNYWEEITINPNNFFNNIIIEDNGGFKKVELTLFDKNWAKLEKAVIKSILFSRIANKTISGDAKKDDTGYFQFIVQEDSNVNMRIRFGYTSTTGKEDVIQSVNFGSDFEARINNNKPVIKSPWIYFMILNVQMGVRDGGLEVKITGYSTAATFLDSAKIMKQFAEIVGTPAYCIEYLGNVIKKSFGDENKLEFKMVGEEPFPVKQKDGGDIIKVPLGGFQQPNAEGKIVATFKSVRELLDDICSKVEIRKFNGEFKPLPPPEDNSVSQDNIAADEKAEEAAFSIKYQYVLYSEGEKQIVEFAYPEPNPKNQNYIRTYIWSEHGQSIVQNLNIETNTIWAQLNAPIATLGLDGKAMFWASVPQVVTQDDAKDIDEGKSASSNASNLGVSRIINATEAASKIQGIESILVADIKEVPTRENDAGDSDIQARKALDQLVWNINNTVFNGTLEIPLDPFYLFDRMMKPYQYIVNVIIKRPRYVDSDGNVKGGEKSFLSGNYVIKKITHSIDLSGATTKLDLMRWPTPKENQT